MFALGLGLIKPYSSSVYISNFYQTFFIVCIEMWMRFELQIRSMICNEFFIHHCHD